MRSVCSLRHYRQGRHSSSNPDPVHVDCELRLKPHHESLTQPHSIPNTAKLDRESEANSPATSDLEGLISNTKGLLVQPLFRHRTFHQLTSTPPHSTNLNIVLQTH